MNLIHTYSIVAIDEEKKKLGVAVQSHWFAVGAVCPWIEPGVGAITTQSIAEISYGPRGFELLKNGTTASEALDELLAMDQERELRQVAIVDAKGNIATHTGKRCIAEAGHITGNGFSVQANMMMKNTVWPAMAEAFEKSTGDLSDRLYASLQAAQNEGGDIRGKQSSAMLVAENIRDDKPWSHIITNLRVDDHPQPLSELKRLMDIEKAYNLMNEGDELIGKGESRNAKMKYESAAALAPDIEELPFWEAVTLADTGMIDQALPIFKSVFAMNKNWALLIERLPAAGLLSNDPDMMKKILSVSIRKEE